MMDGCTLTFTGADPGDVDLLGGKGAGLARMTQDGLPVPDGFIISTRACRRYLSDSAVPAGLSNELAERLGELQRRTGKTFGGGPVPLLLSVRSGAPISMPGMMDTVLNLGLNRAAALAIAAATGDARFMADLLVRFGRMYGEIVPDDPAEQLTGAVQAVFRSWNSRRARTYRDFHHIPHDLGTAVVVQSMVFGNLSADSGFRRRVHP